MSQASIITKSPKSSASSRVIAVTTITNPTDVNSANYITELDPAYVLSRNGRSLDDVKVLDLANEPIPSWKGSYDTNIGNSKVFNNLGITAGSAVKVVVLQDPSGARDDVGASIITGGSDQTHKVHVTHLENILSQIDVGVTTPVRAVAPWASAVLQVLYPAPGRHLCIDKFGVIHLVYVKEVDSYARVVHSWSDSGGEYWQSEYADLGTPGFHYISPTITTDSHGGLHLLFAVDAVNNTFTYMYYVGGSTPAGWTLVSDVGGPFYNRFVLSGDGAAQAYSDQPNPAHGLTSIDKDGSGYAYMYGGHSCGSDAGPNGNVAGCGLHYLKSRNADWNYGGTSLVPPFKTAKMIRYPGIPTTIPKDCMLLFSSSLPAGFTRATEYDGVFVRCSSTAGSTGGSLTHQHRVWGDTWDSGYMPYNGGYDYVTAIHGHTYDGVITHNNDPSAYNFVLGKADNSTTVIPQNAILMFDRLPESYYWDPLSEVGGSLFMKMHKGGASYSDAGGNIYHGTESWSIPTNVVTRAGDWAWSGSGCVSNYSHSHNYRLKLELGMSIPASCVLHLCKCKSNFTNVPLDIFYSYKPPGGAWTTPVNIVNSGNDLLKLGLSALCDSDDNVQVIFAETTCSAVNPSDFSRTYAAKVRHAEKTSSWQPIEDVSTATDKDYYYPSIDIDKVNNIHTAWSNNTDDNEILYRKKNKATGLWDPIEQAVSLANIGNTSDIVVAANGDVYMMFFEYVDPVVGIRDIRLASKKSGLWQPSVNISNLAASGFNQYYGQMYRDKDDGMVMTWGGMGYGANTGYYRIVYRYLDKNGVYNPPLASPASEVFENEAKDDAFPVVFWNPLPDTGNVYTNIVVEGLTFCYLRDIRGSPEVADVAFNSSPFALVGQGKGVLRKSSNLIINRGSICRTRISPARSYSKKIR